MTAATVWDRVFRAARMAVGTMLLVSASFYLPATAMITMLLVLLASVRRRFVIISASFRVIAGPRGWFSSATTICVNSSAAATCTTGS